MGREAGREALGRGVGRSGGEVSWGKAGEPVTRLMLRENLPTPRALAGGWRGVYRPSARAIASMCSGVVPQQPPTIRAPCLA